MPHIGTLARLIIKYPAVQLLGKKFKKLELNSIEKPVGAVGTFNRAHYHLNCIWKNILILEVTLI